MALLVQSEIPFTHPTEGGEFVLRLPLTAGDNEKISPESASSPMSMNLDLIAAALVSWPYDAPVSKATIRQLDTDTFVWLLNEVKRASNIADDEKNASSSSSPVATAPAAERSRKNSGT